MHTKIKIVVMLMVANLCIGCGVLSNGATWTIGSYETDEDSSCSNETYNNSACPDETNPFSSGIKISITNSRLNVDGDRYRVSEDSQVLVHNSNDDELLYESSLIWNINAATDYGFETDKSGYTCTTTIDASGSSSVEGSFYAGLYLTTECINTENAQDLCHTCYPIISSTPTLE